MEDGTPCGPLFLKTIIREVSLDSNATVRNIRHQLSQLDTYLVSVEYDMNQFNLHVRELLHQLSARGHTSKDLLANLFKGYSAVTDENFIRYIQKKEDDYDEGDIMYEEELMQLAIRIYDSFRDM